MDRVQIHQAAAITRQYARTMRKYHDEPMTGGRVRINQLNH